MPHTATKTKAQPVRPPKPRYEDLFKEPVYPDGPYTRDFDEDDGQEPVLRP